MFGLPVYPTTLSEWTREIPVARILASNFGEVFRLMWLVAAAPSMSNRLYFSALAPETYWLLVGHLNPSLIRHFGHFPWMPGRVLRWEGDFELHRICELQFVGGEWWRGGGRVSCLWETQFPQQNKTFWLNSWFIFDQWMDFPEIDCWNQLIFAS